MPQSPTNIFRRSLPSLLPTDYIRRYLTESLKYLPPMPQLLTAIPSVITVENTNGIIPLVKFSREFFLRA